MGLRRAMLGVVAGGAAIVVVASAAWACLIVGQTAAIVASPNRGLASSIVHVSGENFAQGSSVTLHWATPTGVQLGAPVPVGLGRFEADITVPADAVPSTTPYDIVAVAGSTPVSTPFEVLSSADISTLPQGGGYVVTTGSDAHGLLGPDLGGSTGASGPTKRPPTQIRADVPADSGSRAATSGNGTDTGGGTPAANGANPAAPGGGASGTSNIGGSGGGPTSIGVDSGPITAAQALAAEPNSIGTVPSARSFARDLWSGFATGPSTGPVILEAPATGSNLSLSVGIALAVGACVALSLGFGLAETRRRRALA